MIRDDAITQICKAYPELKFRENPDMHDPPRDTYALWNPIMLDRPDWGEGCRELLSEDYSLCERIWQMEIPMWIDLTVVLNHWDGENCYSLPLMKKEGSNV